MDGFVTEFASVNRGVPQGTVLGLILFSIMVNDIRPVYPERNLLFKYADDLTLSVLVSAHQDHSFIEVIGHGMCWRTVFTHELFLYQKSLTRSISDTKTTSG